MSSKSMVIAFLVIAVIGTIINGYPSLRFLIPDVDSRLLPSSRYSALRRWSASETESVARPALDRTTPNSPGRR
jgi:hypothetical protein